MTNWNAIKKGATWGAVAGLAISKLYLSANSPLGFYTGSIVGVFAFWIGLCVAIGAGIAYWATGTMD